MAQQYSVTLAKIIKDNSLDVLYVPKDPEEIRVWSKDVSRPGLMLVQNDEYFDPKRIHFFGLSEFGYLESLPDDERERSLERFFSAKPCCLIITRSMNPVKSMLEIAEKYEVPILSTSETTSYFMATLIAYLGVELAERITRHGVLVEVYGEGILLIGDSGVGKSETAIELINRGHRLIADDAVEIRKVSSKSLVGSAPENIRHFIELRGVGIINARDIFGIRAVKLTEKIDMVIKMELWQENKVYNHLGLEENYMQIMGINIPITTVPVKPGRNLSIIIESAAMNNRQKRMGNNAAKQLLESMGMDSEEMKTEKKIVEIWN